MNNLQSKKSWFLFEKSSFTGQSQSDIKIEIIEIMVLIICVHKNSIFRIVLLNEKCVHA